MRDDAQCCGSPILRHRPESDLGYGHPGRACTEAEHREAIVNDVNPPMGAGEWVAGLITGTPHRARIFFGVSSRRHPGKDG